jgi:hypothetical protein
MAQGWQDVGYEWLHACASGGVRQWITINDPWVLPFHQPSRSSTVGPSHQPVPGEVHCSGTNSPDSRNGSHALKQRTAVLAPGTWLEVMHGTACTAATCGPLSAGVKSSEADAEGIVQRATPRGHRGASGRAGPRQVRAGNGVPAFAPRVGIAAQLQHTILTPAHSLICMHTRCS